jgi:glycosyltransferase involved in cell wall biosynthesis
MARKYDVVISMLDGSYLTTHLLCYLRRKSKLILWGIGVAAGYKTRYDSSTEEAAGYRRLIHKADAALFYSQYPVEKYTQMGVPAEKLFVANNTVKVLPTENAEKEHILFVGSLYKAKKIFELLNCYKEACEISPEIPKLVIVGDGEDGSAVRHWVSENGLEDRIILKGAIFDEKILSELFSRAIVCVSPDQAGLTVLQSFGYGVPFVTHKDAITGGERNNIINRENGILLDSFDEITTILGDCAENTEFYLTMGKNAKKFYDENRTVDHMVKGFFDAIAFVSCR